jgi:hypothetical protein
MMGPTAWLRGMGCRPVSRGPRLTRVLPLLVLMAATSGLEAQTGAIEGVVRGANGRRVPAAQVVVIGTTLAARTDSLGIYTLTNVPAGTYAVRAERVGLAPSTADSVRVQIGAATTVDFWLGRRPASWAVLTDSIPLGANAQLGVALLFADSLAVVPSASSAAAHKALRDSITARGFTYVSDVGGIVVFAIPANRLGDTLALRDSAFSRAAALRQALAGQVRAAGPIMRLGSTGSPLVATDEVLLEVQTGTPDATVRALAASVGGTVVWRVPVGTDRFVARATDGDGPALAARLARLGQVKRAYTHFRAQAFPNGPSNTPGPGDQWHLDAINVAGAEAVLLTQAATSSPLIAVIEGDGIDTSHPQLAGSGWNFQECASDAVPQPSLPTPVCGSTKTASESPTHGTMVAALAVTGGIPGPVRGVCAACKLQPIVYAGDSPEQAAWAFEYASTHGAAVASWSWGFSLSVTEIQAMAPDLILALQSTAQSIPVVMAMGNAHGENPCSEGSSLLQSIPDVIPVGASNHRDYGIPAAQGSCVWLVAPGGRGGFLGIFPPTGQGTMSGIVTADAVADAGYNPGECSGDYLDRDYTRCFGGTSASAPIVAGVIGMMRGVNPALTPIQIKDILRNTTDKIDRTRAGYDTQGHSPTHGYGRVNACAAVTAAAGMTSWGSCKVDLRPWWVDLIQILLLLLPILGFVLSGLFLGWCHWLTIVLAPLAAASLAYLVIWYVLHKGNAPWRWWVVIGAAVVVLGIMLLVCLL